MLVKCSKGVILNMINGCTGVYMQYTEGCLKGVNVKLSLLKKDKVLGLREGMDSVNYEVCVEISNRIYKFKWVHFQRENYSFCGIGEPEKLKDMRGYLHDGNLILCLNSEIEDVLKGKKSYFYDLIEDKG